MVTVLHLLLVSREDPFVTYHMVRRYEAKDALHAAIGDYVDIPSLSPHNRRVVCWVEYDVNTDVQQVVLSPVPAGTTTEATRTWLLEAKWAIVRQEINGRSVLPMGA